MIRSHFITLLETLCKFRQATLTWSFTTLRLIKEAYSLRHKRERTRWIWWHALNNLSIPLWWTTWYTWMKISRWWLRIRLQNSTRAPLFKTFPWAIFLSSYFHLMMCLRLRFLSNTRLALVQVMMWIFNFYECRNHGADVSIAVFTSNCEAAGASARLEYMKELMTYIQVRSNIIG